MSPCICGNDEPCPVICEKHNYVGHGYPCLPCEKEWEAANPRTHAAIARFAAGKGSKQAVDAARRADKANR